MMPSRRNLPALMMLLLSGVVKGRAERIGAFEDHSDVGGPGKKGTAVFDDAKRSYTVTGGGANMWLAKDSFHFVWKKVSGDILIAADIEFVGKGVDPHRKACLLVRQSLDADAVYADAALHGDGLTSLQYRDTKGSETREVKSMTTAPRRLRLEKHGRDISLSVAGTNGGMLPAGKIQLDLSGSFYVGLGVCAHNDAQLETAVFSNIELTPGSEPAKKPAAKTQESNVVTPKNGPVHSTRNASSIPGSFIAALSCCSSSRSLSRAFTATSICRSPACASRVRTLRLVGPAHRQVNAPGESRDDE